MTWLDKMPVIPLSRGVPVIVIGAKSGPTAVVLRVSNAGVLIAEGDGLSGEVRWVARSACSADLAEELGFAHALFHWARSEPWVVAHRGVIPGRRRDAEWQANKARKALFCAIANRHLGGETTDADKLNLAKALAKVVP